MKRSPSDIDNLIHKIVSAYVAGLSEKKISDQLNISRGAIRKRLIQANVSIRGRHQAELLKWSQMSPEQRVRQVEAAHIATRGRKVTLEERIRVAKSIEAHGSVTSNYERQFAQMLTERGFTVKHQVAVGPYNCDLAVGSIAMEIFGGGWHFTEKRRRFHEKRIRYFSIGVGIC